MLLRGTARHIFATVVSLSPLLAVACGGSDDETGACTSEARYGITVTLTGAAEGDACSASVFIQEGDYGETLDCASLTHGQDCTCIGATERPGIYDLSVEKDNATVATRTVTVNQSADGCHVEGEELTIDL